LGSRHRTGHAKFPGASQSFHGLALVNVVVL
jgi:hypothetical protein